MIFCFSYGLSLLYYKNIAQSIEQKWDPASYTLFYVVDRKKGGLVAKYKVRSFPVIPCFFFKKNPNL